MTLSSRFQILFVLHLVPCLLGVMCSVRAGPEEFTRANAARKLSFPRDHGNHSDFKTEWWYITGAVHDEAGKLYGFQATWFRSALVASAPPRKATLATRDLFFFHGALTDVAAGNFSHVDRVSRGAASWADANEEDLAVRVLTDSIESDGAGGFDLKFQVGARQLQLHLHPERPPLLHGNPPGFSEKGAEPGQASHYYSMTRLATVGKLSDPGKSPVRVTGLAWLDHEFGSHQLGKNQAGWDWFSAALDDGTDVMLYLLRLKDGSVEPASAGTLRFADGRQVHLRSEDFSVQTLERWKSTRTGATYPSKWRLRIPSYALDCVVQPRLPDQELTTESTMNISYWEGLCDWKGQIGGKPVSARGYVELVGYAGPFLTEI